MKKIIFLIVCFLSFIAHSQVEKPVKKGCWNFESSLGFATLELENEYKINTVVFDGTLTKEFIFNDKFSLITRLGVLRMNGDFINNAGLQTHIKNDYAILPVLVGYNDQISDTSLLYVKVGMYGAYLFKSESEIESLDVDKKSNRLGGNFGLQASLGLKQKLSDSLNINFGLVSKGDLFQIYKDSNQEYKIKEFYAFQFGLDFQL